MVHVADMVELWDRFWEPKMVDDLDKWLAEVAASSQGTEASSVSGAGTVPLPRTFVDPSGLIRHRAGPTSTPWQALQTADAGSSPRRKPPPLQQPAEQWTPPRTPTHGQLTPPRTPTHRTRTPPRTPTHAQRTPPRTPTDTNPKTSPQTIQSAWSAGLRHRTGVSPKASAQAKDAARGATAYRRWLFPLAVVAAVLTVGVLTAALSSIGMRRQIRAARRQVGASQLPHQAASDGAAEHRNRALAHQPRPQQPQASPQGLAPGRARAGRPQSMNRAQQFAKLNADVYEMTHTVDTQIKQRMSQAMKERRVLERGPQWMAHSQKSLANNL